MILSLSSCNNDKKIIREEMNAGIKENSNSRFNAAIQHFNKVLKIDINNAEAYYNLGNAFYNKGDYKRAMNNANEALEQDSTYGEAYKLRAELYKKIYRNDAAACKDYLRAEKYGVENLYNYTKFCK